MDKKKAYFRFYEELNDFLPKKNWKRTFAYYFWGSPAVKDVIQALGVPHTEVDLILANTVPVDFAYRLREEDRIAVYPVFESLDITAIKPANIAPLRHMQFVLDAHLGKLARYLRMLGFDSRYDNQFTDKEIIQMAAQEQRIILTRDREMLKNNAVTHGYYLRSQNSQEQLMEVIDRFNLASQIKPFSRCMVCNSILEAVNKLEVLGQLKDQTKEDFNEFYRCKKCRKIYWKGSHYERMLRMINGVVNFGEEN